MGVLAFADKKEVTRYRDGDDWIDLPVLLRSGLAVSVPGADQEVKDRVHWVTSREGGDGAVREICELILTSQGHYQTLLKKFLGP